MTLSVQLKRRLGAFDIDASFQSSGGLTALFGPSGSGKTSVINMIGGLISLRARLPGMVRRRALALGLEAVWAYHPVITRRLADACHAVGIELYAWTVDDVATMQRMVALGVDGVCTNDPRLFGQLDG